MTEPTISLADLRQEYLMSELDESQVDRDPFAQFQRWFDEAFKAGIREPSAMTLATVDAQGQPSARIVLLKGVGPEGFAFYSNYESRKGKALADDSRAALVFFWPELERQVRIEGTISKVSAADSDAYFQTRPLSSRISAIASPQSEVVPSRAFLAERVERSAREQGEHPTRPAHWGGYRLAPISLEFWQGRRSRLHDRIRYQRSESDTAAPWRIERLAP